MVPTFVYDQGNLVLNMTCQRTLQINYRYETCTHAAIAKYLKILNRYFTNQFCSWLYEKCYDGKSPHK